MDKPIILDGTADIDSCDEIEKGCWWYLPLSMGLIVFAYALGFVTAIWSIQP